MPRQFRRRTSRPRRSLQWQRSTAIQQLTNTNSAVLDNILSEYETALGADVNGTTIMRIRGEFALQRILPAGSAPSILKLSLGIRVFDTEAALDAAQIAELPINKPFYDWMWVRNVHVIGVASDAPADAQVNAVRIIEVDNKSRRRLHELQQGLGLFLGSAAAMGATETGNVSHDLNILLAKP